MITKLSTFGIAALLMLLLVGCTQSTTTNPVIDELNATWTDTNNGVTVGDTQPLPPTPLTSETTNATTTPPDVNLGEMI